MKDQMQKQLRKIERNAILIILDSEDSIHILNTWLSGGTMSAICGECRQFINKESIYQDKLG